MSARGAAAGLLVLLAACAATPPPAEPADESTRAIDAMLSDWHDAAANADEARYFAHLSSDSIFMGTDATERWDKSAFLKFAHPHFAKGKAWRFHAARRAITIDEPGRVAHFDEDLVTEKLGPARGSGVVVLRDGAWQIIQYNLALTIPNERFDEVHALLESPPAKPAERP
ncbi:MAG: nuclear transport factor 2 family protein [Polyangiaceae bacterium]